MAVRGETILTFAREPNSDRRPRLDHHGDNDSPASKAPPRRKRRSDSPEIGGALRSVYQQTVDETIPPDLLDLLGKLD